MTGQRRVPQSGSYRAAARLCGTTDKTVKRGAQRQLPRARAAVITARPATFDAQSESEEGLTQEATSLSAVVPAPSQYPVIEWTKVGVGLLTFWAVVPW